MLARSPDEAIARLKALMAEQGSGPGARGTPSAALGPAASNRAPNKAASPTRPAAARDASFYKALPADDKVDSPDVADPQSPYGGIQPRSLDGQIVEALLSSLEKKQRECDMAYRLVQGVDLKRAIVSEIGGKESGTAVGQPSAPVAGHEGKPVKGKARRKPKRAASEDGTLGGRVINQLLKHARDSDMSTTDLRQKYQKKLKAAEAQSKLMQKQVSEHREEEHRIRQRLMEMRIKTSRHTGKETKVQEDLQALKQQLATEKMEHDITKQRLGAFRRSQKMQKDAVIATENAEIEREKNRSQSLQQHLEDVQKQLRDANDEIARLNELAEHKAMQLRAVVVQLQQERRMAEEARDKACENERRAKDIGDAAREAVQAADNMSAKLQDQNSTIKALKAERDHAKASAERFKRERDLLRVTVDDSGAAENTAKRKLQMLEEDIRVVSDALEKAIGKEPSFLQDADALHRLRSAADSAARMLEQERERFVREMDAKDRQLSDRLQESSTLRTEVLHLKGQLNVMQAQAGERETALRQRVRRAEQDRDDCLAAAGRADALLSKLSNRDASNLSTSWQAD